MLGLARRRASLTALTIGAATCAVAVATVGGPAFAADPSGNNGTVKIDAQPFDTAPDNQPHVGCTFQVDFYGFDKGNYYATVTFEGQSPTGPGVRLLTNKVFIGQDAAGGGTDLDAQQTYNLSSVLSRLGAPQLHQGYHVKLTVDAPGSQGADVKHKVFWVSRCASTPLPRSRTDHHWGALTEPPSAPTRARGGSALADQTRVGRLWA